MYLNQKKWIAMLFSIKSSFKFPALATPNEVDRVTKDWWRMTSLQEYLKAFCFFFILLHVRIALPTSICLFFADANSAPLLKQQFPELEGFRDSWLDVTTHSETQTPFLHWHTVIFSGRGWSWNLKLDHRALKYQNPIFFLEYLFTHYSATIALKTLLAV